MSPYCRWRARASKWPASKRAPGWTRTVSSRARARQGATHPMMNPIGGTSIHYHAQSWRDNPWDFKARAESIRRNGANSIPTGTTLEDWPVTYNASWSSITTTGSMKSGFPAGPATSRAKSIRAAMYSKWRRRQRRSNRRGRADRGWRHAVRGFRIGAEERDARECIDCVWSAVRPLALEYIGAYATSH